ncbi:hypothetical protein B0H14DRAFT_2724692, partial [Mycena olivaceomarginata]
MIETQLIRSGNVPLSIRWSAFKDGDTTDPRSRDLILTHCTRWGEVLLDMLYYDVQLDWLYATKGRLVASETLEVFRGGFGESDLDLGDIFSTAPSLRKVFLNDRLFELSPPAPALPWARIIHYSGTFAVDSQGRKFALCSSCSLKTLVLMNCSIDADLITVLRGLPSLAHILLEDSQDNQQMYSPGQITLFDAMADDLCPNLTFLMYEFGSQFDERHLFAMAQTRFRLDPPRPRLMQLRLFG